MPITTSSHPLAALRAICGFSRDQMAAIAGMSAANIQNIELGRAPMPKDAAKRIEAATGCAAESLGKDSPRPLKLDGAPYDRSVFDGYRNFEHDAEAVGFAYDDLSLRLRLLLEAAGEKFCYVAVRLNDLLDKLLLEESGIPIQAIEAAARKGAKIETREMTVAQVLTELEARSTGLREWIAKRSYAADDRCKVVVEKFRIWPNMAAAAIIVYARIANCELWRIEFPDGQRLEIPIAGTSFKGILAENTQLPPIGTHFPGPPASAQKATKQPANRRKRLS